MNDNNKSLNSTAGTLKKLSLTTIGIFLFLSIYIFARKFLGRDYIPMVSILATVSLIVGVVSFAFYKKMEKSE